MARSRGPVRSLAYQRIERLLSRGRPVLLDGGIGSELERAGYNPGRNTAELWGTRALDEAPALTREVHQRYVRAGADVITTNTWRLDRYATEAATPQSVDDWRQLALRAVELARGAARLAAEPPAVAFSLFTEPVGTRVIESLAEAIVDARPDVVLVETTESIPEDLDFPEFEALLATGVPLWVSYRWTQEGPCDVSDLGIEPIKGSLQPASGDLFGRAAAQLEWLGAAAVLVNCLPPDRVKGTASFLRDHTGLPVGVYPNLGRFIDPGWDFEQASAPAAFAHQAQGWLDEGAAIVGGCCGVGPEHILAARHGMEGFEIPNMHLTP